MNTSRMDIKGYIPLGAPLIWEEADESEAPGRTFVSFTTNWYAKRAGVDFSEPFHADPLYRFQALRKMKDAVREAFPEAVCFQEHDAGGYERECATVSGVFGVCLIAMLYGIKPTYSPNNWPGIHPREHLTIDQIKALKPVDVLNHPVTEQLFGQMDIISKEFGVIDGFLNYQGVLNNAFKIRGSEIMMDMIDDPEMCEDLFDNITETMIGLAKLVDRRQRETQPRADLFVTSNCVINMISPKLYRELLLSRDLRIAGSFDGFGVHSCNWVLDPYLEVFSQAENLGYIDFGFHSDHRSINKYFTGVRKTVFYDPMNLVTKPFEEVRRDIEMLGDTLIGFDLCLPDTDLAVPDDKIRDFIDMADQIVQPVK